jgi:hypothetical protein
VGSSRVSVCPDQEKNFCRSSCRSGRVELTRTSKEDAGSDDGRGRETGRVRLGVLWIVGLHAEKARGRNRDPWWTGPIKRNTQLRSPRRTPFRPPFRPTRLSISQLPPLALRLLDPPFGITNVLLPTRSTWLFFRFGPPLLSPLTLVLLVPSFVSFIFVSSPSSQLHPASTDPYLEGRTSPLSDLGRSDPCHPRHHQRRPSSLIIVPPPKKKSMGQGQGEAGWSDAPKGTASHSNRCGRKSPEQLFYFFFSFGRGVFFFGSGWVLVALELWLWFGLGICLRRFGGALGRVVLSHSTLYYTFHPPRPAMQLRPRPRPLIELSTNRPYHGG